MQGNRIVAPRASTKVQGFGLCDVLRIELASCQIRGLVDELEERREPLHDAFSRARVAWDALDVPTESRAISDLETALSDSAYALQVFGAIRAQVPRVDDAGSVAIVGPATIIADLIEAVTQTAVETLAERLREPARGEQDWQTRLREAVEAVEAWATTHAECEALVWFRFDSEWDPAHDITWPS